jgi:Putative Ig domain
MVQVNPNTTQMVDEGQPLFFTASVSDNNTRGVTWTLTGSGCAGTGCGVLSAVTPTSVTYTAPTGRTSQLSVSLEAAAVSAPSVTVTVAITVVLPPTFTTLTLPNGANGVPYSQTIAVTGGVQPLTFSIPAANGTLPSGLTLNTTGTIAGRPSGPGNQSNPEIFTVVVTDNGSTPLSVVSPQYSISISPAPILSITSAGPLPPAIVNAFYTTRINTVGGVQPFSWSIPSGSLPPGLVLDPVAGVISGTPTTAQANPYTFTPQVQDSSIPVQTRTTAAPLSIAVTQPPPLQITTISLPNGQTAQPYSAGIIVTGGVPPYIWSVASGQLPSGLTLNPASGQITGTPVLVNTSAFTIQVQDSETKPMQTAPAPFSIAITAGNTNPNSLLSGSYAFLFTGFDTQGTVIASGVFTSNGTGTITTGAEDMNRNSGVTLAATLTGTYQMNTDGTGTMQLVATNIVGQVLTSDYQIVLDSEGNLRFFENDTNNTTPPPLPTHGAGIIKKQSGSGFTASSFGGNYAFGFTGRDFSSKPATLVGFVHADGSSALTPGMVDFNDAGTFQPQLPLSGNFSVATSAGRGTASMVFAALGTPQMVLQYSFYFVSQTDLFFVETDVTDATHPRIAGEMLLQNTGTQFGPSALNGGSVVSGTGLDGTNPSSFVGSILTADPSCAAGSTLSLASDQNDGGTVTGPTFACGTYSVIPNGRVGFTNLSTRVAAAYLSNQNQGFLIGSDSAATLGLLEPQSGGPPFSLATIQGGYTLGAPVIAASTVKNLIGQVSCLLGNGNMTGIINEIDPNGTPNSNSSAVLVFTVTNAANGRGTVSTNTSLLPSTLAFYIVSPSSIRMISTDANDMNPQVIFLDH